mmetsp:Transcript_39796/g.71575  ORF Transcript_39796/g.71575 Transcript_39796/m.71575 type:complete len:220 (-) Transcript_39796:140-799(-)
MPRRHDGPGPGAYEVPSTIGGFGTKGVSLRNGARTSAQITQPSPGPADYVPSAKCPADKVSARCRFSKSSRFNNGFMKDSPGPCQYTPRDPYAGTERITIAERTGFKLPNVMSVTPGPGAYTPTKPVETLKSGTCFCKGSTRWTVSGPASESPGPAAYLIDSSHDRQSNTSSNGFGLTPRLKETSQSNTADTPGPGSYTWDMKPYGPKISMTPRRDVDY